MTGWLSRNWKYLTVAIALVGWAAVVYQAARDGRPIPPPPPIVFTTAPAFDPAAPPQLPGPMGWVDDPAEVEAIIRTLPIQGFHLTPAFAATADPPASAYLWTAAKKAVPATNGIPARNQLTVGSCVSFGSACDVEYLQASQIISALQAGRPPPEWKEVCQEVIYGGSRVQIGGGRIRGDGSTGAWAAQWVQKYGIVPRGKLTAGGKAFDLTKYSESLCRQYGSTGCPKELEAVAREHPVKGITPVRTTAELKAAIANGYPVTVASTVGFGTSSPYTRNAKGQLRASGSWPHQMCFIGYDAASGFYCMNSWGPTWVSGPSGPGDPPAGGFYIDEATAQRMLNAADSWAYSDFADFRGRKLDWLIRDVPRPRPNVWLREFALAW